jgi:hypothetical protein
MMKHDPGNLWTSGLDRSLLRRVLQGHLAISYSVFRLPLPAVIPAPAEQDENWLATVAASASALPCWTWLHGPVRKHAEEHICRIRHWSRWHCWWGTLLAQHMRGPEKAIRNTEMLYHGEFSRKDLKVAMSMKNNLNTLLTEVTKIWQHSFSTGTHEGFIEQFSSTEIVRPFYFCQEETNDITRSNGFENARIVMNDAIQADN